MQTDLSPLASRRDPDPDDRRGKAAGAADSADATCLTLRLDGQLLAIPVVSVRDILAACPITRVPLAPPEVAGSLNLRGRIVTAIDLRRRLGLAPAPDGAAQMLVVAEQEGDLYALLVDQVEAVSQLQAESFAASPATLPPAFARFCRGICRMEAELLALLDVPALLAIGADG